MKSQQILFEKELSILWVVCIAIGSFLVPPLYSNSPGQLTLLGEFSVQHLLNADLGRGRRQASGLDEEDQIMIQQFAQTSILIQNRNTLRL